MAGRSDGVRRSHATASSTSRWRLPRAWPNSVPSVAATARGSPELPRRQLLLSEPPTYIVAEDNKLSGPSALSRGNRGDMVEPRRAHPRRPEHTRGERRGAAPPQPQRARRAPPPRRFGESLAAARLTGLNRSTIADLVAELMSPRPRRGAGTPSPRTGRPSRVVTVRADRGGRRRRRARRRLHRRGDRRPRRPRVRPGPRRPAAAAGLPRRDARRRRPPHRRRSSAPSPSRVASPGSGSPSSASRGCPTVSSISPPTSAGATSRSASCSTARLGLGVPVSVANEADLGALCEHRRGADAGVANLLFVSGEVGIGLGVILGGAGRLGAAGYAGEAGHMLVNPGGAGAGAAPSAAGRPRPAKRHCCVPPDESTGRRRGPVSTRCSPAPPPATSAMSRRLRGDRPVARHRDRRSRQPLQPRARRARRVVRPPLSRRRRRGHGRRRHPRPRRARRHGQGDADDAGDRRPLLGAAELAFSDLIRHPGQVAVADVHQPAPTRSGR